MPGWLRVNCHRINHRLARFAETVFGIHAGSREYKARRSIELIEKWLLSINCSIRLSDLEDADIDDAEMLDHSLLQAKIWRMSEYDRLALETVIKRCQ